MWIQKAEIVDGEIRYNILGKIKEDEIYDEIIFRLIPIEEIPIGNIDGTNNFFSTSKSFFPESFEVFINGLKQMLGRHYSIIGSNSFQLNEAPLIGDEIVVKYLKRIFQNGTI